MKFNRSGERFVFHDCKWTELWRDRKGTEDRPLFGIYLGIPEYMYLACALSFGVER